MGFLSKFFGNGISLNVEIANAISNGAVLLDVRSVAEFKSGSVPGAINIPVDNITTQFNKIKGKESVVVFCRSGNRSRIAKSILLELGIKNVIDGGTWQSVNQIISKSN